MPPHTTIPARAVAGTGAALHRGRSALARATLAAGVLAAAAAGTLTAAISPAAAAPAVLYAAPAAAGTGDCSTTANACTLTTALADVGPGGTIELVTPGSTAHYLGNWTVATTGTSAAAPVMIQPAPGLASQPVLDGNRGNSGGCTTASCAGPVLAVGQNEYVALSGIAIIDANNPLSTTGGSGGSGGGLDNSGTVTITGSTFSGNTAGFSGGAISNGLGTQDGGTGTGSVTVTDTTFTGNSAGLIGGAIDSGSALIGGGTVTVTGSTFSGNTAPGGFGGAIDSGFSGGGGTVTVATSTFTGNTASNGGAIDSGQGGAFGGGTGTVTVTASTFSGNHASNGDGGAIDSGDGGSGSVTVAASTFSGNTANGDGGAIDSGDASGGGSVQVTGSTFTGNSVSGFGAVGNTIYGGFDGSSAAVRVAGDLFDGSCVKPQGLRPGTWTDGGYNAGTDTSCFSAGPGDVNAGSSAALNLGPLASNGGPTQTILPGPGSKAIAIIPNPTSITLGGGSVSLCPAPAGDQRGYVNRGSNCDAGAVQTAGQLPLLLKDSAVPATFNAAGQPITYTYMVTNGGPGTLTGVSVTDPAVPGISCPEASLPPSTYEDCTGTYTTTAADLAAGKITDTATATATTANGVPLTSTPATVTVHVFWPLQVIGYTRPGAHGNEGYYLGVKGSTWQLLVTQPGFTSVPFTGQISVPAGTLGNLTQINPATGSQVTNTGKAITFTLPDHGQVTGFSFTTGTKVTSITFTLDIAGQPATTNTLYLGRHASQPATGSPLTFTR
jgi:uncharacterized repeat protein (TIGR01451 family)